MEESMEELQSNRTSSNGKGFNRKNGQCPFGQIATSSTIMAEIEQRKSFSLRDSSQLREEDRKTTQETTPLQFKTKSTNNYKEEILFHQRPPQEHGRLPQELPRDVLPPVRIQELQTKQVFFVDVDEYTKEELLFHDLLINLKVAMNN